MMGRVRSKLKRAAFSNSSAREGGAEAREAAATAAREARGSLGNLEKEIWGNWNLGFEGGVGEGGGIRVLEEAMIMLAIGAVLGV